MALDSIWGYSIQAVWTGTPNGTIKLQASSDPINQANQVNSPINWTDIANSAQVITAAGNFMWNITSTSYNYVQLVYLDASSGSSTAVLNANFNAKGV